MLVNKKSDESAAEHDAFLPPVISLPKGGGAIRGLGEKFAANPVTGTGSMRIPLAASSGRAGFGPQLALSYDSASGNGPFGFGWNISIPAITRKTEKGLPLYRDTEESDVYLLSGVEDLVPVLQPDGERFVDENTQPGYIVHRYRPRNEGLFACIERWTDQSTGEIHWRSISRDNLTTLYGTSSNSRIADPSDPMRVYTWLICESYDDKGNTIVYAYKEENLQGVDQSHAHERNRTPVTRSANRYLKRIQYGNTTPYLPERNTGAPLPPLPSSWLFEMVFDYGEHDADTPTPDEAGAWSCRNDPFSTYRPGFEVRTYRLCQRVLMFHHFPSELGVGQNCLVRSIDFTYSYEAEPADPRNPIFSFLLSVTQNGYKRQESGSYLKKSLPPLEFMYSEPTIYAEIQDVDPESLENLPYGLDSRQYRWVDLDGEGLSGILTEQAGGWFYKRNLSLSQASFGPIESIPLKPSLADLAGGRQQFLDLDGDGRLDLVNLAGPLPGFFERTQDERWEPFTPFVSLPALNWADPNLKFVDLTGDGRADILISEEEAWCWYPSLAEAGYDPPDRALKVLDEERGPRLCFADETQSIYLIDMSGDGLVDIVRIRNGEICYWPNLGYGRFGAKVTMDNAPWFDPPDLFDQRRIRPADIDGSGATDIIYLSNNGVRIYFNQSGNGWSAENWIPVFPAVDDMTSVQVIDLLGNGTACLVWSSALSGDARRPMRYLDLMGGNKPHLLVKSVNNLGAETHITYAPSTRFYLADQLAGQPWITRIPFPVHVVERVETYDRISGNRFVTRYAYHHGYFDGYEREFRGFGLVEQKDTEVYAALSASSALSPGTNIDEASHIPPVVTKTWFHTGAYLDRQHISNYFAGLLDENDTGEYYREPSLGEPGFGEPGSGEPGLEDAQARDLLLEDTRLPPDLTLDEEREACRALKGAMLRQEVYALDGTQEEPHPYLVTEQNFTIRRIQPKGSNRHAVFFTHAREAIAYHYERNPADPRITHTMTLEVDDFGNVLKEANIGYGRRQPDLSLTQEDQVKQAQVSITLTENSFTNPIDLADDYRTPLPAESRTFELTGLTLEEGQNRFSLEGLLAAAELAIPLAYEQAPAPDALCKRLIEHIRSLYRPDDLGASAGEPLALLPLGQFQALALPGETYKLAFTPGLVTQVYGGKVNDAILEDEGRYVHIEGDDNWWIPSGRIFLSPGTNDSPSAELAYARQHFFLPQRMRDPFHRQGFETESFVSYDPYDLLVRQTRDALDNTVSAVNDYRVQQPLVVTDANGNRKEVVFDALGLVAGSAVMGKTTENLGDTLEGFEPDLNETVIMAHMEDPLVDPHTILGQASTRLVYDLFAYHRTKDQPRPMPTVIYTMARETHASELHNGEVSKIQHRFSYSDGLGREIQQKIQAEAGPLAEDGAIADPRWVGSGWTIYNNKGKPVRQFEPFFTGTHHFEFDVQAGVSPILFYDPLGREVGTLNPNHTWQKVVFDAWCQQVWDVNDTVLIADPQADPDLGDHFRRLLESEYLPTWHSARAGGELGLWEQAAAFKAAAHESTPAISYLDSLGRMFLSIAHNRVTPQNGPIVDEFYRSVVVYDIEGNQREVIDARDRVVMHFDFDMLGHVIHSVSMDAGERWMLGDVAGKPVRAWDSRGHEFRTTYDKLQRPVGQYVRGSSLAHSDPRLLNREVLFQKTEYGEGQANDTALNLRTRVWRASDSAGILTNEAYDFRGNLLRSSRQLAADYQNTPDWAGTVELDAEIFASSTTYDALNRPTSLVAPDGSEIRPGYNEASLLEQVDARLRGVGDWTAFVSDIDYNAKGQRDRIVYGNGVTTAYTYDPLTFRLSSLKTSRTSNGDLQNLSYTYDPVGNVTAIQDEAQQTTFFDNTAVEPDMEFIYDAIYRLIAAQGREHIGLTGQIDHSNPAPMPLPHPNNGEALRRYTEEYVYDAVGNILKMVHSANGGNWSRYYEYNPDSNRLLSTSLPGDNPDGPYSINYPYDVHGSMTSMPHLTAIQWDFKEMIQEVDLGGGGSAYYVYDAAGQRVRKVHKHNGSTVEERIYLGGFEIYRKQVAGGLRLERETLHILDGQRRIALVETKTLDQGVPVTSPSPLIRFQLDNHLGSACLELDASGQVISYEEYHPYGTTAYHAARSDVDVSSKRFRYTGKERDEETGLYYHGARYYACWLGRWTSVDPSGLRDGLNVFAYALNNPSSRVDRNGRQSFNAGEQLETFQDEYGNKFVEFRAKENTWVSAAAKSVGLDEKYTKEQGYGAYVPGVVLNSQGQVFEDTDKLEVGEIFYIRIGSGASRPGPAPNPTSAPAPEAVARAGPPPEEEGWGKFFFRNTVDLVLIDKVTLEVHGGGGLEAMEVAVGGQAVAELSMAATLITNPNSPDFLKVAANPSFGVSGGLKEGAGQTATGVSPLGVGGVSLTWGEFFGPSSKATIASLGGHSVGGYLGVEGKVGVGAKGAGVVSVSIPNEGYATWVDAGVDITGKGSTTFAATGEIGGGWKYTGGPVGSADLMPVWMRDYHKQYVDWVQSGTNP